MATGLRTWKSMLTLPALVAGLVLAAGPAQAQDGVPDPSFGEEGGVVFTGVGSGGFQHAMALQSDGKIITAGESAACFPGCVHGFALTKLTANGIPDLSFGVGGSVLTTIGADAGVSEVAVQPDGKVLAVGSAFMQESLGWVWVVALARYNPDGSLDPSFGKGGIVTSSASWSDNPGPGSGIALQPDGKIVVSGTSLWYFDGRNTHYQATILRFNSDGSLDSSFGTGGVVRTPWADSSGAGPVVLAGGGKILVGGSANLVLARYNPDGSLDSSFGRNGLVTTSSADAPPVVALALQGDGKTVAVSGGKLLRYDANGARDLGFGTGGKVAVPGLTLGSVAVQAVGKIVAAGQNCCGLAVARFHSDGSLDQGFGGEGVETLLTGVGQATGVALQPDGKIVAAGWATATFSGARDWVLARLGETGAEITVATGGSGQGTITGGGSWALIQCPPVCSEAVPEGAYSTVALMEAPSAGSIFTGWGGTCPGTRQECDVRMNGNQAVGVYFAMCVVPKVTREWSGTAEDRLKAAHCAPGRIHREFSRRVALDHVIWQAVKAGTKLPVGSKVALVISKGRRR